MFTASAVVGAPLDLSQRSSRHSNVEIENSLKDKTTTSSKLRTSHHKHSHGSTKSDLIEKKICQLKKTLDATTNESSTNFNHEGMYVIEQFSAFFSLL
jgi:hypothetical protein